MSGLAILAVGGFVVACAVGIYMGLVGAFADAPPFMQGEGGAGRYDKRIGRAA
ncbi:MAG: hypothetical protein HZA24_04345 [Nitrospirae bacterium]|nr:hypothetical protein [Nitrospirota bacterium]